MKSYYFKFVLTSLKSRRIRSWLTMIGIFIGIAAVVALIGLGEGLREAINSQFGFLGTDILSITASGGFGPPGTGVVDPLTDKELDAARKVPGVEGVAGRILESGKLVFNKKVAFGYSASMADGKSRDILEHILNMDVARGRLLEDGDSGRVVLGYDFYEDDELFGEPIDAGDKVEILDKEFEVIGILEKKGNFQIDRTVFINEDDLRDLVGRPDDEYDIIGVQVVENADIEKIQASIEKELRKIRDVDEGEEDFSVETPANVVESVNSILLGVQVFVYVIASISLLVGGIGIMNTMYTAVIERTRDIGIMKSIGAKNSTIFVLFFIESGLLGSVGGIIGALLGFASAKGFAFIGKLVLGSNLISAQISPQLIIGALLFSFVVGSFFGTLPAVRASKLNPVDALSQRK
ncbi:FtsX-like permease family protein [Candidatus Woesearchaeota archaeon]|nr:FtsX-like permease family protein [Candidatus Woesearchaeota archaeon]